MSIAAAFLLTGLLELAVGLGFHWLYCRAASTLKSWPDPGPWGLEKAEWDKVHSGAENLRVLRVVCLNTGASMVCCAVLLLVAVR